MKNVKQNVRAILIARQTKQTLKNQQGITLIALIITIIVLLILAGVTISMLTGENGILKNSQTAAYKYGEEKGMEQIQLALGDDAIKRSTEKPKPALDETRLYDIVFNPENEKWVSYIEKIEDENIEGVTIINDEGYIYDVIVNGNGEIEIIPQGINKTPIISKIKITNKQLTSITIEVETLNAEGATYKYSYKKQGESYKEPVESDTNTYTYTNLEISEIYTLKVEVEKKNKRVENTKDVLMGELPEGTITFTEAEWENAKTSIQINTIEEGYILQYQINGKEEGVWTEIENGASVTALEHNDTVYARLWNEEIGKGTEPASVTIKDKEGPQIIEINITNLQTTGYTITVEATDGQQTGIKEYRYYIDGKLRKTSIENTYTETELVTGPTYKAYVVVVDNAENETKTEEQEVKHEHIEQCYSTACTGEFKTISKAEENWLTCEHVHIGDTKKGGECYTVSGKRTCGGVFCFVSGSGDFGNVHGGVCPGCGNTTLGYNWEHLSAKCDSCDATRSFSDTAYCSVCGVVRTTRYGGSRYICSASVNAYIVSCSLDGSTLDYSRAIEELECTTCGASGTHKEAVDTFACEMCRQEHSTDEEIVQHNTIPEYTICAYD